MLSSADVVSGVSGGAIIAALWCCWCKFNAPHSEGTTDHQSNWDRFEGMVVAILQTDLRLRLLLCGFGAPLAYMVILVALLFGLFMTFGGLCRLLLIALAIATAAGYALWLRDVYKRTLIEPARSYAGDIITAVLFSAMITAVTTPGGWFDRHWDTPSGILGARQSQYQFPLSLGLAAALFPIVHWICISYFSRKGYYWYRVFGFALGGALAGLCGLWTAVFNLEIRSAVTDLPPSMVPVVMLVLRSLDLTPSLIHVEGDFSTNARVSYAPSAVAVASAFTLK